MVYEKVKHNTVKRVRPKRTVSKKVKLWRGGVNKQMITCENITKATIVEGQFAEDIRQQIMKKPSPRAILRNQRASALLKKLRK